MTWSRARMWRNKTLHADLQKGCRSQTSGTSISQVNQNSCFLQSGKNSLHLLWKALVSKSGFIAGRDWEIFNKACLNYLEIRMLFSVAATVSVRLAAEGNKHLNSGLNVTGIVNVWLNSPSRFPFFLYSFLLSSHTFTGASLFFVNI